MAFLASDGMITVFLPTLGYETCQTIAKQAIFEKKPIMDVVQEMGYVTKEEVEELFAKENIISAGIIGKGKIGIKKGL